MKITFVDILLRLFLAVVIGGVIGYEREVHHRTAGFRTHILVCIGAAIVSLIQINIGNKAIELIGTSKELANVIKVDYGRLGAQVITGVGFLGAGTIIHEKGNIKGLTTAASLWVVACLGLAVGMGDYITSFLGAVFIVITLVFLKKIQDKVIEKMSLKRVEVQYYKTCNTQNYIEEIFDGAFIKVKSIEFINQEDEEEIIYKGNKMIIAVYTISKPKYIDMNEILNRLGRNENIISVKTVEFDNG